MRVTKAIKAEQIAILETVYKDAKPALHYNSPFELLVAVVLSAQCTDERVNIITARLFPTYSDPADMLALGTAKLEVIFLSILTAVKYRPSLINWYNCPVSAVRPPMY